jgi:hypothetical protein
MNCTPRLERVPVDTGLQSIPPVRDQRIIVLLLIGLLIAFFHLLHTSFPNAGGKVPTTNSLLWFTDSSGGGQIYAVADSLLPPLADNYSGLYAALGLQPPLAHSQRETDFFPGNRQTGFWGLVIKEATAPVDIPVPAFLSPFLFEKIPINEADEEILVTIPGIGPRLARQILAIRRQKGRIDNPQELLEVPGIHYKKLQKITDYLSFR